MLATPRETMLASDVLKQSPIQALRSLELMESPTSIIIEGILPSYYLKQLAQETVLPVLAGRQLVNRICVGQVKQ